MLEDTLTGKRKDEVIQVRMTPEMKRAIIRDADSINLSYGEFIRGLYIAFGAEFVRMILERLGSGNKS